MEYIRTATREYDTGPQLTLEFDGRSSNLVVEGADTDRVTVQIVAHVYEETPQAADETFDRILEGIHHGGDRLRITAPLMSMVAVASPWFFFNRGVRVDYALTVPRHTNCRLVSRSGKVEVGHVSGRVEVTQRSGRTSLRAIDGDATVSGRSGAAEAEDIGGALQISSASGKVSVRRVKVDVRVECDSGAVLIENVGGNVEASAQSGRIDVTDVGGNTRIEAKSGRVLLKECHGRVRLRSVSGQLKFQGPIMADVAIESVSGTIQLDVDPAHPFRISAETVSGPIHSDLSTRSGAPPREDAPSVTLKTVSGAISIGRYLAPAR